MEVCVSGSLRSFHLQFKSFPEISFWDPKPPALFETAMTPSLVSHCLVGLSYIHSTGGWFPVKSPAEITYSQPGEQYVVAPWAKSILGT